MGRKKIIVKRVKNVGKKPKCSVCCSQFREQIDRAILDDIPYRQIGAMYGFKHTVIFNHKKNNHVIERLERAVGKERVDEAFGLLEKAQTIYDIAIEAARKAIDNKQFNAVGPCLTAAQKIVETMAVKAGVGKVEMDELKDSSFMQAYLNRGKEFIENAVRTDISTKESDQVPLETAKPETGMDSAMVESV